MRLFVGVGETPCVVFGPGDVRLAHAADESVPLDEVRGVRHGSWRRGSPGSSASADAGASAGRAAVQVGNSTKAVGGSPDPCAGSSSPRRVLAARARVVTGRLDGEAQAVREAHLPGRVAGDADEGG